MWTYKNTRVSQIAVRTQQPPAHRSDSSRRIVMLSGSSLNLTDDDVGTQGNMNLRTEQNTHRQVSNVEFVQIS